MLAMDDFGPIEIPTKTSFFFILSKEGLFALSSRRNTITKTQLFMPSQSIKPIVQGKNGPMGGVEELGNFKEGYCFKVNAVATGGDVTWIMCAPSLGDKNDWMKMIAESKGFAPK